MKSLASKTSFLCKIFTYWCTCTGKTRHVFVKHGCPWWQQSLSMAKSLSPTFWSCLTPRGTWCQWSVSDPKMKVQSKFDYCIITQTLNIALLMSAGQNYGQTKGRTNGQTHDPITTTMPPVDLSGWGHKNLINLDIFVWINKMFQPKESQFEGIHIRGKKF